ncbi:hypothetical protein [Desulfotomaculum sp. 1211_IL3151]|uniref:hypothetical protein n=1 Tax=Desulfotomaculum sp. 1211_IL3151 TaxID=3084055 RepID=UPI002FDA790C
MVIIDGCNLNHRANKEPESVQPSPQAASKSYTFPGEFDQQQAIWLQWPPEIYNTDRPIYPVAMEIMKALDPYIRVNLMVAQPLYHAAHARITVQQSNIGARLAVLA